MTTLVKALTISQRWMKMNSYYVIHVNYGKKTIEASTTYEACKKYADHFGLRSTRGIDAYLMTQEGKVADV